MKGKSTDGALAHDILEWSVPEEVLAVLLKDPNCHTLCDKLSWSHYRLPDIAKLEK